MKKFNVFSLLLVGSIGLLTFEACTDLKPDEQDSTNLTTGGGGGSAADLVVSAYKDLGSIADQDFVYALGEHSTDEMMGPTRGTDWGDNGIWRSLHAHTWDATHNYVLGSWNRLNSAVYKCNQILAANPDAKQTAEAKFMRAYNMFQVMDLYGQVPFRETTDGVDVNPRVMTRAEAFEFVLTDLTDALKDLPTIGPMVENTKASKAAANTMLARLYLNKAVYTGASDNADMDKVIGYCDAVTADGFTLEPNYFDNFQPGADNEPILSSLERTGQNRIHMTLHYDQNPDGWNGFTTLSEFYDKFEPNDQRIGKPGEKLGKDHPFTGVGYGFLIGQQVDSLGNNVKNSRNGLPLAFTKDVKISGAGTEKGIRVIKYHAYGTEWKKPQYPKYIYLRYGDVVTMKAEAQLRKSDNGAALTTVNNLRAARGASALSSIDLNGMLDERGREMYWEGVRRTDLIRFGKFAEKWQEKESTDAFRALYPIPQQALDSNPNLEQNPGY